MTVDEFSLSSDILGPHPETFYGAVGRIVCVCAVVEQQIAMIRHNLAQEPQGRFTHQQVNQQSAAARRLSNILRPESGERLRAYLDAADAAFRQRNNVVHSAFPAQPDGRIWGHRPTRDKGIVDGTADTIEYTLEELAAFIGELSDLALQFNKVFALCDDRAC